MIILNNNNHNPTNTTLITNKTLTREKTNNNTYLLHPNYEETTLLLSIRSRSLRPKGTYVFNLRYQHNSFCISAWSVSVISQSQIPFLSF